MVEITQLPNYPITNSLYLARETAVSNALRVQIWARCLRYSPEANRSELVSTPSAACSAAAARVLASSDLPFRAFSAALARYALSPTPVTPIPADWHLPEASSVKFAAMPTTANPEAGWRTFR